MPEVDWRVDMAKRLFGQQLVRKRYVALSEDLEHDHCAACWQKLAERGMLDAEHWGYATTDDYPHGAEYEWICATRFNELHDVMHWQEVADSKS
jgi:hypothetical protein